MGSEEKAALEADRLPGANGDSGGSQSWTRGGSQRGLEREGESLWAEEVKL